MHMSMTPVESVKSAADVLVDAGQQLERDILTAIQQFRNTTGASPSAVVVEIERTEGLGADRDTFTPVDVRVTVEA